MMGNGNNDKKLDVHERIAITIFFLIVFIVVAGFVTLMGIGMGYQFAESIKYNPEWHFAVAGAILAWVGAYLLINIVSGLAKLGFINTKDDS